MKTFQSASGAQKFRFWEGGKYFEYLYSTLKQALGLLEGQSKEDGIIG